MLRRLQSYSHDEFSTATRPAQAQLTGPAQVKVYNTNCSDKVTQPHEFTYLHKSPRKASFSAISAGDINLQRTLLASRAFFNIIVTATVVATVFAGIFPFSVCAFINLIFRRRLWQCNALFSLLLFDQLKRAKEEIYEKTKDRNFMNLQKTTFSKKLTWSSLARAMFLATSFPLVSQNSLANLALIAKTSPLG
jgi:hypothetical protein